MSEAAKFTIHLEQAAGYDFRVKFDIEQADELLLDEPTPLGQDRGPNASRLVAAAAANCLSASLMYCLARKDAPADSIQTEASCTLVRNDRNLLRIGRVDVRITATGELLESKKTGRCLDLFEDFCVVTQSLRQGFPVGVEVVNSAGELLHKADA